MLWGFTVLWAKRSPHRTRSSSELVFIVSLITPSFPTFKPVFGCLCRLLSDLTSWKPLVLSAASVLSYLNSHHMFRSEPLERGLKGVHQPVRLHSDARSVLPQRRVLCSSSQTEAILLA